MTLMTWSRGRRGAPARESGPPTRPDRWPEHARWHPIAPTSAPKSAARADALADPQNLSGRPLLLWAGESLQKRYSWPPTLLWTLGRPFTRLLLQGNIAVDAWDDGRP